jgi:hypothetical protein
MSAVFCAWRLGGALLALIVSWRRYSLFALTFGDNLSANIYQYYLFVYRPLEHRVISSFVRGNNVALTHAFGFNGAGRRAAIAFSACAKHDVLQHTRTALPRTRHRALPLVRKQVNCWTSVALPLRSASIRVWISQHRRLRAAW